MSKGKRAATTNNSRHSRSSSSRKFHMNKKFFIFLLVIIAIGVLIYMYPSLKTASSDNSSSTKTSNIDNTKTIIGIDDIEVLGIDIESRNSSSIFNVKIHNKSNNTLSQSKVHFYAIDSDGKTIFGMPIDIPELKSNETSDLKVFCTDDISNAIDYNIVAIEKED